MWAWFALGFNHMDDPLDLVVAAVVGGFGAYGSEA